jgi:predicted RND superfamily exporter protein
VQVDGRAAVMDRVRAQAVAAGLEPVQMGGLYDLQAQLGRLIASSLRVGIGGLLLLFVLVGFVVSRSAVTTVLMLGCLVGIPMVVLGTFGHAGIAVDIITSPAANVALAMGVDSMIHLVVRVRRLSEVGSIPGIALPVGAAWTEALRQIRTPVLAATAIVCAGFGIFVLSAFPPTQRFGLAVILGTVASATMALVVLPGLAMLRRPAE